MLNDRYDPPSQNEEDILDALKQGGRLRPTHISKRTDKTIAANNHYLRRLIAAGWVHEPEDGLYELWFDPREISDDEIAALFIERALVLTDRENVVQHAENAPEDNWTDLERLEAE